MNLVIPPQGKIIRFFGEDAPLLEPLSGEHMIVVAAVLYVVQSFTDVDMVACPAIIRLDAFFKGLVGDREQRVHTEHGAEHRIVLLLTIPDEVGILFDRFVTFCLAVAVGDLIA